VMDYFDAFADTVRTGERLERARRAGARALVVSFDTDWRFDTAHSREIVRTLSAAHLPVTFREIGSPHGHDSFLLEVREYHRTMATFLSRMLDEADGGPASA